MEVEQSGVGITSPHHDTAILVVSFWYDGHMSTVLESYNAEQAKGSTPQGMLGSGTMPLPEFTSVFLCALTGM